MSDLPNLAEIRQFLQDAFGDTEIKTLCADYFPEASSDFTSGMLKSEMVLHLIGYCERRELVPHLLAALRRLRPRQFEARFPNVLQFQVTSKPAKPVRDPRQVFICHAHKDAKFAHKLADDLRHNDLRVWIAPESIRPGEKWMEAINRGLEESSGFVLVLTPSAITSHWVMDETNVAIEYEHEGRMHFVPLMVEPCDVPPLWRAYQHMSFQGDYERGLTALLDTVEPERRARRKREAQEKAEQAKSKWLEREMEARRQVTQAKAERQKRLAAEKAEVERWEQERQKRKARLEQILTNLRDPLWQGIGAIVAILALAIALGAWLWPNINIAPAPLPTPTKAVVPTTTLALTAIAALTVTPAPMPLPTSTFTPVPASITPIPPTATRTPTITPSPTSMSGVISTRISEKDGMVIVYVAGGRVHHG
jgi:hypothetical protein